MAEYAQMRVEEYVPIVEEIKQLKLISPAKIKEIIGNMQDHEHKIQKMDRSLEDVLSYVEYQLEFLDIIRRNREDQQIFSRTQEIDEKLQHRINSLFGVYQRIFYNDMKFWLARINFTLGQKWYNQTSKVYKELTSCLGKQHPFLWQRASDFEWKRNPLKGIDSARTLLKLGIRSDQNNLDLYVWAFELELKHAEFLTLEQKNLESKKKQPNLDYDNDIEKCFMSARVLFNSAKDHFWGKDCTVKLYVLFHSATTKYPSSVNFNADILKQLEANCTSEEETYHVLAMIAFNNGDLEKGREHLDKGLNVVQTVKMYDLAVKDLFELVDTEPSTGVFKQLYNTLNRGHNKDKLSVSCYVKWAELGTLWKDFSEKVSEKKRKNSVSSKGKESPEDCFPIKKPTEILDMGMNKYQDHPELIVAKAQAMVNGERWQPENIIHLINVLGDKHGTSDKCYKELCSQLFMNFMLDPFRTNSIEKLVERVNDKKLKEKLTVLYLKHVALNAGLSKARIYYKKVNSVSLSSYKLQLCMAEMEFLNIGHNSQKGEDDPLVRFRDIMNRACMEFGGATIEPWIDFIRFEKQLIQSDQPNIIYDRALKKLPDHLRESFISAERNTSKKQAESSLKRKQGALDIEM